MKLMLNSWLEYHHNIATRIGPITISQLENHTYPGKLHAAYTVVVLAIAALM